MKAWMCILSLAGVVSSFDVDAIDWSPDGINASYGKYLPVVKSRDADFSNYRVGLVWDWNQPLYQSDRFELGGYFELAGSVWKSNLSASDNPSPDGKHRATAVSFSPVIRLSSRNPVWGTATPFVDVGAGGAWLSEVDLEKEKQSPINMGGHWQFELRLMAGLRFGERQQYEIRYGWMHYSNAYINDLNESIDFHVMTFGWYWH
ncbi:hypothetical protein ACH42_08095 [Endozoicomonas sp. (ex Bugula neritina AB1)]|nr:hypothetical protein ACH42_08095 [Endozoicomonas sp. (ex Bugula neritina AB1)]